MKRILIIITSLNLLVSCNKEDKEPKQCNCGMVVSDDASDNSVVIRNSCSNNEKKFILSEGDWMNAHPGQDYCITNVTSW